MSWCYKVSILYDLRDITICLRNRSWCYQHCFFSELGGSNFRGVWRTSPPAGFRGRTPDGGLGDINPQSGFRGTAPGGGLGAKLPEAEETVQIVHFEKYFVSGVMSKWAYRYCWSTQICIQNVGLDYKYFVSLSTRCNESEITCDIIPLKPHRSLAK